MTKKDGGFKHPHRKGGPPIVTKIKGEICTIGPEGEYCHLCVGWASSGIRPFGRCGEHDEGVQDLWWCPTFTKK